MRFIVQEQTTLETIASSETFKLKTFPEGLIHMPSNVKLPFNAGRRNDVSDKFKMKSEKRAYAI